MIAYSMRRAVVRLVCVSFLFGTVSVNAGFWDTVSNGARWLGARTTQSNVRNVLNNGGRWLGNQAVEFGTYWALNTNVADNCGTFARAIAPGTYSRLYLQKLDALHGVFAQHKDELGIISPVASALLAFYGGVPLAMVQQVGAIFISGALSQLLSRQQTVEQPDEAQSASLHRSSSDSCLLAEGTPANRPHVQQNLQSLAARLVDEDESLSKILWWLSKQILRMTGSAMVMQGAQMAGGCICPLLCSNEWQHLINYAAMRLYGVGVEKLSHMSFFRRVFTRMTIG